MPTEIEILNRLINIKDYVIDSASTVFDEQSKIVKLYMLPQREAICNHCGCLCEQVKDRHLRKYRDLFFGVWKAEIWIQKRRVVCRTCGIKSERTQFADERSNFTRRFEISVFRDTIEEPIAKVSTRWCISWDATRNIERKYLQIWEQYKGPPRKVKWLGIDEICFGSKDNLYTIVSDLERGEVLGLISGNCTGSIDSFFKHMGIAFCNGVRAVCIDMWKAFATSVQNNCKNARIVYDKFHIIRHLNNAVDEVRRSEFFRKGSENREIVRGKRWLILRRWFNLSISQKSLLKEVFAINRRLAKAHYLKEIFGHLWFYKSRKWAIEFLNRWRAELRWQRLLPLEKFYSMVEKHLDGILNYCDIKIPLGLVESLNGKIKTLLRRTRGFMDERHFALRIMFMTDSQRYNFLSTFHT
jgi:transposase